MASAWGENKNPAPASASANRQCTLQRGRRVRTAVPGHGVVGQDVVYVVAITPRGSTKHFWRVYRRYSEFARLKAQLLSQGLRSAPLPPENEIAVGIEKIIESRSCHSSSQYLSFDLFFVTLRCLIEDFTNLERLLLLLLPLHECYRYCYNAPCFHCCGVTIDVIILVDDCEL